ncbi:hypothetical protein J6590_014212 [Homalodisca vitripennis]|nr:hypothetical protein J6590_014212 [Homalodisca vitripennis]
MASLSSTATSRSYAFDMRRRRIWTSVVSKGELISHDIHFGLRGNRCASGCNDCCRLLALLIAEVAYSVAPVPAIDVNKLSMVAAAICGSVLFPAGNLGANSLELRQIRVVGHATCAACGTLIHGVTTAAPVSRAINVLDHLSEYYLEGYLSSSATEARTNVQGDFRSVLSRPQSRTRSSNVI